MLNLILFGPPGAGKGTQSENLIRKFNLVHLSTGDLLRSEIKNGTALGLEAKRYMDEGVLVPDAVVISMIENKYNQNAEAGGFIFDGFPRTVAQAEALDAMLGKHAKPITCMIALEVPNDELLRRTLERQKIAGRADDNEETFRKRMVEYESKTRPVAEYYSAQEKFKSVQGVGEIDEIFAGICTAIDALKFKV
ncbi:MAG: adenylate kinase [Bacteroidetes bacterium]|nr:adenylate kinase [Bacteroidota bacterium]